MIKGSPWDTSNSNSKTTPWDTRSSNGNTLGMEKGQQKRVNKWQNIRNYSFPLELKKLCFSIKSKIAILSDVVLNVYTGNI